MPTAIDVGWKARLRSYEIIAPANTFKVAHGYKDREEAQLRLEDGGAVYASYTTGEGREIHAARDIPFDTFMAQFREFVDSLRAAQPKGERDDE